MINVFAVFTGKLLQTLLNSSFHKTCYVEAKTNVLHNFAKALKFYEGVVSKETVVLRRWGSSIQKFGFINGVDNVNWPPYRDSKS